MNTPSPQPLTLLAWPLLELPQSVNNPHHSRQAPGPPSRPLRQASVWLHRQTAAKRPGQANPRRLAWSACARFDSVSVAELHRNATLRGAAATNGNPRRERPDAQNQILPAGLATGTS